MTIRIWKHPQWHACLVAFLARQPSENTRLTYRNTLRLFFAFVAAKYGRERTPDKITRADIEEFLQRPVLRGRAQGCPLSAYTYNGYLGSLCSFFLFASEYEIEWRGKMRPILRGKLPTAHVKRALEGEVNRDMTEEEVHSFFAAIDRTTMIGKRDFALFWTLFVTGRRRREICQLVRGDLEQVNIFRDGRLAPGWIFHFKAKRRTTKESAELPTECIAAIRDFHEAAGRDFERMEASTPLFPRSDGIARKPLSLSNVDIRFRYYARMVGIGDNIVTHSLRWENSYQRYLESGKDLMKVRDQMGWKSIEQCARYVTKRERKLAGDPIAGRVAAKFLRE